ncbi:MAG: hypothetical protein MJY63_00475 [Paludibacteraceae bacterium]|nr:hypothetical protein [Paludibacteraceae bacterium]
MKKFISLLIMVSMAIATHAKPDFEIPDIKEYATAEECAKDNDKVLKTAKFYLDAELPNDIYESSAALRFMIVWATASKDIMLTLSAEHDHFLKCEQKEIGAQLMGAYFAGSIIYCLENKQKEQNFDMHYFALTKMLNYYDKNRSITGNDKYMDKVLKDFKSGKLKNKEKKRFK